MGIQYDEFFQRCDVIGMTTTGAAKNRKLLSLLKCRMVLVEEAAQVLEPHVIAALPPTCDHLVMIGESDTQFRNVKTPAISRF